MLAAVSSVSAELAPANNRVQTALYDHLSSCPYMQTSFGRDKTVTNGTKVYWECVLSTSQSGLTITLLGEMLPGLQYQLQPTWYAPFKQRQDAQCQGVDACMTLHDQARAGRCFEGGSRTGRLPAAK